MKGEKQALAIKMVTGGHQGRSQSEETGSGGQTQGEAEFFLPRTDKALAPVAAWAMLCHHPPARYGRGGGRVLAGQLQLG